MFNLSIWFYTFSIIYQNNIDTVEILRIRNQGRGLEVFNTYKTYWMQDGQRERTNSLSKNFVQMAGRTASGRNTKKTNISKRSKKQKFMGSQDRPFQAGKQHNEVKEKIWHKEYSVTNY